MSRHFSIAPFIIRNGQCCDQGSAIISLKFEDGKWEMQNTVSFELTPAMICDPEPAEA
jgi:hypothetical protein